MSLRRRIMETSRTTERGYPAFEDSKEETTRSSDKAGLDLGAVGNKVSPGFTEEALSNFMVLKKILGFLSNDDLETCCKVNKFWKSIAGPMYISYYEVEIKRDRGLNVVPRSFHGTRLLPAQPEPYYVIITGKAPSKKPKIRKCKLFPFACDWLEEALKVENISISLRVREELDSEGMKHLHSFLTKFGHVVQEFTMTDGVTTTASFCGSLSPHCSNLKHLI